MRACKLRSELHDDIVDIIPNLRSFARSLVKNPAKADDLVQGALVRALGNLDKFETGTNLRAWLFTILRNLYYSEVRKCGREVEDADGSYADRLTTPPSQIAALELKDFGAALETLPSEQREALIMVGASGYSYEDAADVCNCAVGTIKSRVSRGRSHLAKLLHREPRSVHGDGRPRARMPENQQSVAAGW